MIPDHLVYRAFPSTLLVTLDMYLVNMHAIYDNMEGVSKVCEETLKDR